MKQKPDFASFFNSFDPGHFQEIAERAASMYRPDPTRNINDEIASKTASVATMIAVNLLENYHDWLYEHYLKPQS